MDTRELTAYGVMGVLLSGVYAGVACSSPSGGRAPRTR